MQRMAAVGHDVRFFAGQAEAEAERLETHRALLLVLLRVAARDDGERGADHDGVRVRRGEVVRGRVGGAGARGGLDRVVGPDRGRALAAEGAAEERGRARGDGR